MKSEKLSDGREIYFLHTVCPQQDAPTIVFVHGFPLDHSMWLGQMPLAETASLLMVDLPGFGKSDPSRSDVSMRSFANDVVDLMDQLAIEKVIFCGLSMGGYIGWEFAVHHGNRLAGLICCNTRANADDELIARGRRVAAGQVLQTGAGPVAKAMKQKLFSPETVSGNPELVQRIDALIRSTDPKAIASGQLAMAARQDHASGLYEIDCPVLVIAGADDEITPANEMEQMSLLLNQGTFVEIASAGHLSPAEQPAIFNHALLHWLA